MECRVRCSRQFSTYAWWYFEKNHFQPINNRKCVYFCLWRSSLALISPFYTMNLHLCFAFWKLAHRTSLAAFIAHSLRHVVQNEIRLPNLWKTKPPGKPLPGILECFPGSRATSGHMPVIILRIAMLIIKKRVLPACFAPRNVPSQ